MEVIGMDSADLVTAATTASSDNFQNDGDMCVDIKSKTYVETKKFIQEKKSVLKVKEQEEEEKEDLVYVQLLNSLNGLNLKCFRCHGEGWHYAKGDGSKSNRRRRFACIRCLKVRKKADEAVAADAVARKVRCHFSVCIVGAGIGGCAIALALVRLGYHVIVLERDESFGQRKQGYGLTLQQGHTALHHLGLVVPPDTPSKSHFVFDVSGNIIGYFGVDFSKYNDLGTTFSKKQNGKFNGIVGKYNAHVPRQHLRWMLWTALQKAINALDVPSTCQVRWGARFNKVEPITNNNVRVQFTEIVDHNGSTTTDACVDVDLVIGCDGIYSNVRKQIFSEKLKFGKLNFQNCVVILGITPMRHDLTHERVCETMDGSTRIYTMPFTSAKSVDIQTHPLLYGKDSIMWQLSFIVESEAQAWECCSSLIVLKNEALRRCGKWHPPIPQLIEETISELISGHPVYDQPELNAADLQTTLDNMAMGNGNVILLGDACHGMTPFKAQGANQTLLDVVRLAKAMADPQFVHNTTTRAQILQDVQKHMCECSVPKVRGSRAAVKLLHQPEALASAFTSQEAKRFAKHHVSALHPVDLNQKVINLMGYGHRPHVLHQTKITKSHDMDSST